MAWSPDGSRLATGGRDGQVRLWDLANPTNLIAAATVLAGHTGWVAAVAWSPDGTRLATAAGYDWQVRVWDPTNPTKPTILTGHLTGRHGDVDYFRTLLSPVFAMRRANGTFNNREEFLARVAKSPQRQTENESVTMYADTRAIVSCTVSILGVPEKAKRFHNLRFFVRSATGAQWQLLAWSNEMIP